MITACNNANNNDNNLSRYFHTVGCHDHWYAHFYVFRFSENCHSLKYMNFSKFLRDLF